MGEGATVETLTPGRRIEVRSRFDRSWSRGFEVVEVTTAGYRVRRLSDDTVLPVVFDTEDVRREHTPGQWWS